MKIMDYNGLCGLIKKVERILFL